MSDEFKPVDGEFDRTMGDGSGNILRVAFQGHADGVYSKVRRPPAEMKNLGKCKVLLEVGCLLRESECDQKTEPQVIYEVKHDP